MTRTDDTEVPDYPGLLRLDGRRFVVLGAGQGIGRQASHALAQAGARLVVVDKDPDLAADIAAEVDATPWSGDATNRDDVARLASSAGDALGGIDGLVDIIGMAQYASLLDVSPATVVQRPTSGDIGASGVAGHVFRPRIAR